MTRPSWIIEVYAADGAVAWSGQFPVWSDDTHYAALQRIAPGCTKILNGSRTGIIENCAIGLSGERMVPVAEVFAGRSMREAA